MTEFNILFTSVGRRVSLIKHFQKTLKKMGLKGRIVGADLQKNAPAFHVVDRAFKICRIDDPSYVPSLLEICKKENITLLFPLIDTDLSILANNKKTFSKAGTQVVISEPQLIEVAINKQKTHDFFRAHGIDTPECFDTETAVNINPGYPLFMKPLNGSASLGTVKIRNKKELLFFKEYVQMPILQEYMHGTEYTLDVLFDFGGEVRCVVPRMRVEVRAGEVSKSIIVDNRQIVDEGWKVAESLQGAIGCINIQCFLTLDGSVKFIEINPRFGGGTPLSLFAGADFPRWIIEMAMGKDPGNIRDAYRKNVCMLRYDDAVFL